MHTRSTMRDIMQMHCTDRATRSAISAQASAHGPLRTRAIGYVASGIMATEHGRLSTGYWQVMHCSIAPLPYNARSRIARSPCWAARKNMLCIPADWCGKETKRKCKKWHVISIFPRGSLASRPPSPLTGHHPKAPSLLVALLPSGSLPATSSGLSPSGLSLHSWLSPP